MKIIALFALVCVAAARPQGEPAADPAAAAEPAAAQAKAISASPAASKTAAAPAAPAAQPHPTTDPRFFGPGLNNQLAIQPNRFIAQRALEVLKANPGMQLRVFVNIDGSMHFTDIYGREVEVLDRFERDPLELAEEQLLANPLARAGAAGATSPQLHNAANANLGNLGHIEEIADRLLEQRMVQIRQQILQDLIKNGHNTFTVQQ